MTNTQQPLSALLFAAGLGTRMGHLSKDRPKPLIKVGKQTLLDHALDLVAAAGIKDTCVNVHYKAEMIQKHLAGTTVRISDETAA